MFILLFIKDTSEIFFSRGVSICFGSECNLGFMETEIINISSRFLKSVRSNASKFFGSFHRTPMYVIGLKMYLERFLFIVSVSLLTISLFGSSVSSSLWEMPLF